LRKKYKVDEDIYFDYEFVKEFRELNGWLNYKYSNKKIGNVHICERCFKARSEYMLHCGYNDYFNLCLICISSKTRIIDRFKYEVYCDKC